MIVSEFRAQSQVAVPAENPAPKIHAVDDYDLGWRDRIAGRAVSAGQAAVAFASQHKKLTVGTMASVAALGMSGGAEANILIKGEPVITTQEEYSINGAKYTSTAVSQVTIGAYAKANGISRAERRKIIREGGRCWKMKVGTPIINSLIGVNGKRFYFRDVVKAGKNEFCKDKYGRVYMVKCKNLTFGSKPPKRIANQLVEGKVVALRTWNSGSAQLAVKSEGTVGTGCQTSPGNYSSVSGYAVSTATANVSWRNLARGRGRNIETELRSAAEATVRTSVDLDAQVKCDQQVGPPPIQVCPPEAPGAYPHCVPIGPPPPTFNRPPVGYMKPPEHMYVSNARSYRVCVDNISDPDNDPVRVTGFDFRSAENPNQQVGSWQNTIIRLPEGAQCVDYTPGTVAQRVNAYATLTDDKGGYTTVSGNFPVLADDFGGTQQ